MAVSATALLPTHANKTAAKSAGGAASAAANQSESPKPSRQSYPLQPALPMNPATIPTDAPSDGGDSRRTPADESPLFLQCKLAIGAADDPQESEADRAAEEVMGIKEPHGLGRSGGPPQLRRLAANNSAAGMCKAPPIVHEALRAPGRPLDRDTREFMEPRFGRDLSNVRIHTGAQAAASARAIKARAYTAGNRIVWDEGCYAPETDAGKRLLAHELAHVVQQGDIPPGRTTTIRRQTAEAVMEAPPAPALDSPQPVDGDPTQETHEIGMRNGRLQHKAETNLPGLDTLGSKAARIKDSTKNAIQGQVEQALQSPAPGAAEAQGKEEEPRAEKSLAGLSTGNLALIDTELAEHQRWGAAATKVGAAGSGQRAEFVAQSAAGGSNVLESLGKGALMGGGIKLLEKGAEKGALKLAAKFAPAVGKFAPLPAVGAVIGGVMSAYELASPKFWEGKGDSVARFGQGSDLYDTLANTIEAISTVIEVATQVLNVIAGVIGAISIGMWIITIITVGIASPLAATLSTIAGAIGLASMALDGINSLVLKQLVTVFRALHTFTSEADPRDVVTQGNAIGQAAGAATGFLAGLGGGLAGGAIAEKGVHMASGKPTPKISEHANPGPRAGDGPSVKAEPSEHAAGVSHETAAGGVTETARGRAATSPGATEIPEAPPTTEALAAQPETAEVPEEEPATETPTTPKEVAAPEAEAPPENAAEAGQQTGGGEGEPKEGSLSKKEQARLKEKLLNGDLTKDDIEKMAQHAGISPEEMKAAINRAQIEREGLSTGMKDKDVPVASSDQKKPFLEKYRDRQGKWQMEKMPGRPETPAGVKSWARRMARRAAGRIIQESLKSGVDDAYTNRARAFLDAKQLRYIEKTGKLPRGVEFHHLFTVADFPEFAHLAEVGGPMSAQDHVQAGHGGDTSAPIETPELRDEDALKHPSLSEDVEARKGARMKKGPGVLVEAKRQMGRHEAAETSLREAAETARRQGKGKKADRLESEAKDQKYKARLIRDALPKLDALLRSASGEAQRDLGRPANTPIAQAQPGEKPPTPTPTLTPAAEQPQSPAKLTSPDAPTGAKDAGPDQASDLRAKAMAETPPILLPEPVTETRSIVSTAEAQPLPAERPIPNAVAKTPFEATPDQTTGPTSAESAAKVPDSPATISHLPTAARIGANRPTKSGSSEGKDEEDGGSGQATGEPIVEHVNPNYPPPPCAPQDIVDVENEILETLDARAQSEEAAKVMAGQEAHHKANEKPLVNMQTKTGEAISATEAHKQAVDRRTQANEKKKENEDHAHGMLADYTNKAAKLSVITVPMRGFERFTSLAHSLPDNEDSLSPLVKAAIGPAFGTLITAKQGILKMNSDSKKFLAQLDDMDNTMEQQKVAQADRNKQVAADAATLNETDKNADESGRELNKARETSKDLNAKNKDRVTEAGTLRREASQNAATLDAQAREKTGQAQNLSSGLQAWAKSHQQAREDSLEQTKSNLEQQGYRVTEVKEL